MGGIDRTRRLSAPSSSPNQQASPVLPFFKSAPRDAPTVHSSSCRASIVVEPEKANEWRDSERGASKNLHNTTCRPLAAVFALAVRWDFFSRELSTPRSKRSSCGKENTTHKHDFRSPRKRKQKGNTERDTQRYEALSPLVHKGRGYGYGKRLKTFRRRRRNSKLSSRPR